MFANVLSFLQAQIICGLCLKHNGLLQAKLAADKVTHTYTHMRSHTCTHIKPSQQSSPPQEEKREG